LENKSRPIKQKQFEKKIYLPLSRLLFANDVMHNFKHLLLFFCRNYRTKIAKQLLKGFFPSNRKIVYLTLEEINSLFFADLMYLSVSQQRQPASRFV